MNRADRRQPARDRWGFGRRNLRGRNLADPLVARDGVHDEFARFVAIVPWAPVFPANGDFTPDRLAVAAFVGFTPLADAVRHSGRGDLHANRRRTATTRLSGVVSVDAVAIDFSTLNTATSCQQSSRGPSPGDRPLRLSHKPLAALPAGGGPQDRIPIIVQINAEPKPLDIATGPPDEQAQLPEVIPLERAAFRKRPGVRGGSICHSEPVNRFDHGTNGEATKLVAEQALPVVVMASIPATTTRMRPISDEQRAPANLVVYSRLGDGRRLGSKFDLDDSPRQKADSATLDRRSPRSLSWCARDNSIANKCDARANSQPEDAAQAVRAFCQARCVHESRAGQDVGPIERPVDCAFEVGEGGVPAAEPGETARPAEKGVGVLGVIAQGECPLRDRFLAPIEFPERAGSRGVRPVCPAPEARARSRAASPASGFPSSINRVPRSVCSRASPGASARPDSTSAIAFSASPARRRTLARSNRTSAARGWSIAALSASSKRLGVISERTQSAPLASRSRKGRSCSPTDALASRPPLAVCRQQTASRP